MGLRRTRFRRWLCVVWAVLVMIGAAPVGEAGPWRDAEAHAPAVASLGATPCADDCEAECQDAGCHGATHHCGCCAPAARVAPTMAGLVHPARLPGEPPIAEASLRPPDHAASPPRQPPRA